MKAIIASKPGGPEVLKIINTDEPEVQRGEVKMALQQLGWKRLSTLSQDA